MSNISTVGRCVSHINGDVLIVKANDPSDDAASQVQVLYLRNRSTRLRDRLILLCDPHQFRAGNISESVIFSNRSVETRRCPICNASPKSQTCTCSFPIQRPAHSFDFAGIYNDFRVRHTGMFRGEGTTTIVVPDSAMPECAGICCSDASDAREDCTSDVDILSAQMLCLCVPSLKDAVRPLTGKKYLQAPALCQVDLTVSGQESHHVEIFLRLSSVLQSLPVFVTPARNPSGLCALIPPASLLANQPTGGFDCDSPCLESDCDGLPAFSNHLPPELCLPLLLDDGLRPCVLANGGLPQAQAPVFDLDAAIYDSESLHGMNVGMVSCVYSSNEPESTFPVLDEIASKALFALPPSPTPSMPSPSGQPSHATWTMNNAQMSQTCVRKSIVTVPPPVNIHPTEQSGAAIILEAAAVRERTAARTQKNRLAAARSNIRRKQQNDGLKRAVSDGRATIARLRVREEILFKENVSLKQRIFENALS
jgi:hypothetical protein